MNCYYHPEREAVGICRHCGRGLCAESAVEVGDMLACRDRHEEQVRMLVLSEHRAGQQAERVTAGLARSAAFYGIAGALFAAFGLLEYRYLGLQAVFILLVGLALLWAALANLMESRKYR